MRADDTGATLSKGAGMNTNNKLTDTALWRGIRWVVWGGAAALLMLPLIAMQFTREVNWTASDFLVMGVMLGSVGVAFELALRVARSSFYMLGAGLAAGTAFLVTWSNLAVGIIGSEDNSINLIFFGVIAVALIGTLLSRLRPEGMARAMYATAAAQAATAVACFMLEDLLRVTVIVSVFTAMWLLSALCFQKASESTPRALATA